MRHPQDFDELYRAGRDRLLLQTFALTGDLSTTQDAVQEAYVSAWHHRRRFARQADPEAWLRVRAWRYAARLARQSRGRSPGRRGAKQLRVVEEVLGPAGRETLDALATLSRDQRRVLVLAHLTDVDAAGLSRESKLSPAAAWFALRTGTESYAALRAVPETQIPDDLARLASATAPARLARPPVVRRAGARRRRRVAGTLAAALALTGVLGSAVYLERAELMPGLSVDRTAADAPDDTPATPTPLAEPTTEPAPTELGNRHLLTAAQVGRALRPRDREDRRDQPRVADWRTTRTAEGAFPSLTACQPDVSADPTPLQALRRDYRAGRSVEAVQSVELSATLGAARAAYRSTVDWYTGCEAARTQLLAVHDLGRVGDDARLVVLRRWGRGAGTLTVGISRTGRVVTTTVRRSEDPSETDAPASAATAPTAPPDAVLAGTWLERAVDLLCADGAGTGACAERPEVSQVTPPSITPGAGLLDDLDFPQAGAQQGAWRATDAGPATDLAASFACDDTDFSARPVRRAQTRTFLIVGEGLPPSFGVTQNAGTLPSAAAARDFVAGVRDRFSACEDEDPASTVQQIAGPSADVLRGLGRDVEVAAWRVDTEIGEDESVRSLTAIVRRGAAVTQIGFLTAPGAGFADATFVDLAERAAQRLGYLPEPRGRS